MVWSGLDYDALQLFVVQKYEDDVASQINRPVVLPRVLGVTDCDNIIQWDVRTGTAVYDEVVANGADLSTARNDTISKAYLSPGTYADYITISDKAILAAAAAGNPSALIDLMGEKLMESSERLAAAIAKDIYWGSGEDSDHIMGLIYDTPSTHTPAGGLLDVGVYAGKDRASYTQFKGNVDSGSSAERDLTIPLMRKSVRTMYKASGFVPNVIVCDPLTFDKYGELTDPHRRYLKEVTVAGRKISLDAGFNALEFDGVPVFRDNSIPTDDGTGGKMLFIHDSAVRLRQMRDPEAKVNLTGSAESQFGPGSSGFRARIKVLAPTGLHVKMALELFPQVQVKWPIRTAYLNYLRTE